jgi:hypothetical protein
MAIDPKRRRKRQPEPEPELPETIRRDTETDVERAEPGSRQREDSDLGEVPARRGSNHDTGDIERGAASPPASEGHHREMEERRPHREGPI